MFEQFLPEEPLHPEVGIDQQTGLFHKVFDWLYLVACLSLFGSLFS